MKKKSLFADIDWSEGLLKEGQADELTAAGWVVLLGSMGGLVLLSIFLTLVMP